MKTVLLISEEWSPNPPCRASNDRSANNLPDEGYLMPAAAVLELPQEVVLAQILSRSQSLEQGRTGTDEPAVLVS